MTSELKNKKI